METARQIFKLRSLPSGRLQLVAKGGNACPAYEYQEQSVRHERSIQQKRPSLKKIAEEDSFVYLRFSLTTSELTSYCRIQLEGLGLECLDDGAPYEAYGVVSRNLYSLRLFALVPEILAVEEGTPPCCK